MSTNDNHYVEIVEIESGKIEKVMGPMSESKADHVERGVIARIDTERFFVRSGTREALDREAVTRAVAASPETAVAVVAQGLGLKAEPGFEAELEDGQGLAVLAAAAHEAEIYKSTPERLRAQLGLDDPVFQAGQHARRAGALAAELSTTPEALRRELLPAAMAEQRRRDREEAIENAAADVLALALELTSAPRSQPRLRALRSAALKYGALRGIKPTATKKGPRK